VTVEIQGDDRAESSRATGEGPGAGGARVAVFAPNPLLSVTIEARGASGDDIHMHAAGQGVWLSRMARELGAEPVLCGFIGGETGLPLRALLAELGCELRLVETAGASGCYVTDRRGGERELISQALSPPASRHEADDLLAAACAAALTSRLLVVCNSYPADTLPLDAYGSIVADARANGTPVVVDLSTPRLDHALEGGPDLVKLNDWELAEFVRGPVSTMAEIGGAADELRSRGAASVLVTRAERPAFLFRDDEVWELVPPHFTQGSREGCGDTMVGGIAAARARGLDWKQALVIGAAAGATNFLRHGLGSGTRATVEELAGQVSLRRLSARAEG
jgi:1-phosphofructokinase